MMFANKGASYCLSCIALISLLLVMARDLRAQRSTDMQFTGFQSNQSSGGRHNIIKVNPFMILHGYFPIAYERQVVNRIAIELGGGLTIKDFIYHSEFMQITREASFSDDDYGEFKEAKNGFGYYGTLKLYLGSYRVPEPSGAYMGLQAQYREHSWIQTFENSSLVSSEILADQRRRTTDFMLLAGWQDIMDDNIVFEINAGIGVRDQSHNRKKIENSGKLADAPPVSSTLVIAFNLKVGYAF